MDRKEYYKSWKEKKLKEDPEYFRDYFRQKMRERRAKDPNLGKCEHCRSRGKCKICYPHLQCEHGRYNTECRTCNPDCAVRRLRNAMFNTTRRRDKKAGSYDENNHITKEDIQSLFDSTTQCHFCEVELTYGERCSTLATIDRKDNSVGHVIGNCVLSCLSCNSGNKGGRLTSRYNPPDEPRECPTCRKILPPGEFITSGSHARCKGCREYYRKWAIKNRK